MNRRDLLKYVGLAPLAAWLTSRVSAVPALPVDAAGVPVIHDPPWQEATVDEACKRAEREQALFAKSHPRHEPYRYAWTPSEPGDHALTARVLPDGTVFIGEDDNPSPWDDVCEYETGRPIYVGTDGSAVPEGHELRDPAHPHPVGTLVDFTTPNTAWVRLGPGEDVRRGDLLVRDGATVRKAKTCAHGKRTGEWCTGCVDWAHT